MNLTTQATDNPDVMKFVADRTLNPGAPKAFYDAESARADPFAADIFAIEGVGGLFIINEFLRVKKHEAASWNDLIPKIESAVRRHWGGETHEV